MGFRRTDIMVPISGTTVTRLLLLVFVCSFSRVALGRGVTAGEEVITSSHTGNGVEDGVGRPGRSIVEGKGKSTEADHSEATRVVGVRLIEKEVTNVKAETTNDAEAGNANSTTTGASPPILPPPGNSKNKTAAESPPENVQRPPAPPSQDTSPGDEARSAQGGTCTREHGPVIGKLAASGGDDEAGDHDYTLTVENGGGKSQLAVTIKPPRGWKASPADFELTKGGMLPVTISVVDREAAKLGARINVSWGEGDCYVSLPAENVGDNLTRSSYSSLFAAPGAFAFVLGGILVFALILGAVGVWRCVAWRAHARRHGTSELKYQELEMALPSGAIAKQNDEMSPSADGWDEVWEDDDWQDMEAVRSSSSSLTLSSKGLNSRRANKDGGDSSWDD